MKFIKNNWIVFFLMLMCLIIFSCGEKKEGKVVVSESKFVIRQDSEKAYVIDAVGKVKNVGEVDVKNIVVTGNCRSCIEMIKPGYWFVSGTEKTPEQKDTISYLPVGAEETFSFKEVAFMYNMVSEKPESMPEQLEVVVESFDTADK
ncbi:MAG: hypothetical protein C4518_13600 [Desulfobacteraceae bacterium]|nr:MAG: hypothetical protein C4518_13600 [Desulfobacteraceae bacterium]